MKKNNPILSIIIISYNTSKLSLSCIKSIYQDSLLASGEIPFEIIIVDNNSTDDTIPNIKKLNKDNIIIIKNKVNSGFAKANNQGIQISKGEYILLLNSDTVVQNSSISQCLTWLSSHPECACVTPKLLNPDGTIQETGGYFPNLLNTIAWRLHIDDLPFINTIIKPIHPHSPNFYTKDSFYTKDQILDWLTGAFILTRKSILNKVKGFNENYFMYAEELEMLYRIKQAFPDLHNQYLSGPQIIHVRGGSSSNRTLAKRKEIEGIRMFFQLHKPNELFFLRPLLA